MATFYYLQVGVQPPGAQPLCTTLVAAATNSVWAGITIETSRHNTLTVDSDNEGIFQLVFNVQHAYQLTFFSILSINYNYFGFACHLFFCRFAELHELIYHS